MHIVEIAFWIFFAACAAWVAWGLLSMFLDIHRDRPRRRAQGGGHASSGTAVPAETFAAGGLTSVEMSSGDATFDSGSSDASGSDSGGGGDSSGGGGDFGGGGSSGGW
jgi:hypothetical protein